MQEIQLNFSSEKETVAFGARLAAIAAAGDAFCLSGPLGAGKTTLARGFISAAGGAETAPSPTFTLVETYATPRGEIWHFDLYRLENARDVWELGWEDALETGICLIEWPEKAESLLPETALVIGLAPDNDRRRVTLRMNSVWRDRLAAAGIA